MQSSVSDRTAADKRRELIRRRIVNLIFLFYLLLIFEGALRKWIFPQYQKIIFFARDPVVLYIYLLAFKHKFWPKRNQIYSYAIFIMKAGTVVMLIQLFSSTASLISLLYGWRMWFSYIPLAIIIGEALTIEDIKRLMRLTLIIAIPLSLLVTKQIHSPYTAYINKTVDAGVFYSNSGNSGGDITRVTATFSFFHSWQIFLGSIIAFCLIFWALPKQERGFRLPLLLIATAATLISFAADITRLPTYLAIIIVAGALCGSMLMRDKKKRLRIQAISVSLIIGGVLIGGLLFSDADKVRTSRFNNPNAGLSRRVEGMFTGQTRSFWKRSMLGIGLGAGSRGASLIGGVKGASEDEWNNHITEAGTIFGVMYILFRIMLVWWLFRNAVKATRVSNNPMAMILFAFSSPIILIWYLTSKGQTHAYGWLLVGLCIAANHLGDMKAEEQAKIKGPA